MSGAPDQSGLLPDLLGLEWLEVSPQRVRGRFDIRRHHLAPNGYLHAASLVALADTACGYGCQAARPDGATGFTTIELKTNHLGTAIEGGVGCEATPAHLGRTTQVWEAVVTHEGSGRTLVLFRCTQLMLYPR